MELRNNRAKTALWNTLWETLLIIGLIAWGVAGRLWIDAPNFKTVGAACLLAGMLVQNLRVAWLVPVVTLMISDMFLGGYEFGLALFVYLSTAAYLLMGHYGGKLWLSGDRTFTTKSNVTSHVAGALGISLAGSLQFFLITNFAVWALSGWYGPGWNELSRCFLAALPFFKWTLFSDLCFFALPVIASMTVAGRLDTTPLTEACASRAGENIR